MKKIAFLFIGFGFFIGLSAQNAKPVLTFEEKIHDFGEVKEDGGAVYYVFEFTNKGTQPLVIHNVQTSCGCTSPEWTRTPIQAGGKGTLKATFDPRNRPGNFNKSITITSNAQQPTETLRIVGKVLPKAQTMEDLYPRQMGDIRLKSSHLSFTRVEPGTKKTETLELINISKEPVTVSFSRLPVHLELKMEPATIKPGGKGTIVAVFDASKKNDWGFVVDQVFIQVNGVQNNENRLSVSATIEEDYTKLSSEQVANAPDIQFSETSFDFKEIKSGDIVNHTFKVTNNGKTPLVLRKVKSSCGCTVSQPDKTNIVPGDTANITVTYNSRGRNGRQNQSITVYSNDPKKSTMLLRISATIAN